MARKTLVTPAVRELRAAGVAYTEHRYRYRPRGGAADGAQQLGIAPGRVVKTLILEDDSGAPLCVLMHGDREVSLQRLARSIGVRSVSMADPHQAARHSGYQVGGTSPFGLASPMPVYCEESILAYDTIAINGGRRGFLIELAVADAIALLEPELVEVAI